MRRPLSEASTVIKGRTISRQIVERDATTTQCKNMGNNTGKNMGNIGNSTEDIRNTDIPTAPQDIYTT